MTSVLEAVARSVGTLQATRKITELERIIGLPVHDPDWTAPDMTPYFRKPGGTMELRELQNKGIYYSLCFDGLLGFIGVGEGKTLLGLMIAQGLRLKHGISPQEMVLLIPPEMRADLGKQWSKFSAHFDLPHGINIITYNELSRPESTARLEVLRPRAIISDEADKLKDPHTATGTRFIRYMERNSIHVGGRCMFFAMSGTLVSTSLKDWAHIAKYALGTSAPVPLEYGPLETFCAALDVRKGPNDEQACAVVGKLRDVFGGTTIRDGFRRRLQSAPGVTISDQQGIDAQALFTPRLLDVPESVAAPLDRLVNDWELPSGEVTESALEATRKAGELSCGFYYIWDWPNGVVDREWVDARQAYNKAMRDYIKHEGYTGSDSPALVERLCLAWNAYERGAVARPDINVSDDCRRTYVEWAKVKNRPQPPTRPVWLDLFAVYDAWQWVQEQPTPSLVWYEQDAFGEMLAGISGIKKMGTGPAADQELASYTAAEHLILSRKAHFRGKNLQLWHRSLMPCPVSSGRLWEQLAGRTYRRGQEAPTVHFNYNVHTEVLAEAITSAREKARFIEQTHGVRQIMNHAKFLKPVQATPVNLQTLPEGWGAYQDGTYAPMPVGWQRHPKDFAKVR